MIGRLRGELIEIEGSSAVVEAAGVGYEVELPAAVAMTLPPLGEEVTLLIRQIFREDDVALYGFLEPFQRRLFDLLLTVKGCGPKLALAVIGEIGEEAASLAIVQQDARALTRASGVGPRLAERIILELKDKIQTETLLRRAEPLQKPTRSGGEDDLVEALIGLGSRRGEAEVAAQEARQNAEGFQGQLKYALRLLGK